MEEKVKEHSDLMKINKAYVVNVNEQKYRQALARLKTNKQLKTIEERIDNLETNIGLILSILQENLSQQQG